MYAELYAAGFLLDVMAALQRLVEAGAVGTPIDGAVLLSAPTCDTFWVNVHPGDLNEAALEGFANLTLGEYTSGMKAGRSVCPHTFFLTADGPVPAVLAHPVETPEGEEPRFELGLSPAVLGQP